MRLRLLLPMLCSVSACFLLADEEAPPPPEGQGGWGGEVPPCDGTEAHDCAGAACGEQVCYGEKARVCTGPCIGWRWLRASSPEAPEGMRLHAAACDEARGIVWVFGGQSVKYVTYGDKDQREGATRAWLWSVTPDGAGGVEWRLRARDYVEKDAPPRPPGVPSPRSRAALLLDGDGAPIVIGGLLPSPPDPEEPWVETSWRADQEPGAFAWRFDPASEQFSRFEPLGPDRTSPEVVPMPDGSWWIFGGYGAGDNANGVNYAERFVPGVGGAPGRFERSEAELYSGRVAADVSLNGAAVYAGARGVLRFGGREADSNGCANEAATPNESCYRYETTGFQLVGSGADARFEEDESLKLPEPREEFGAVGLPSGEVIAYDGWFKWSQLSDEPRHRTLQLARSGWTDRRAAEDWRDQVPGGAIEHPGQRKQYALVHCGAFGGTLLIGGEEKELLPDAKVFLLPDPPP